MASSLINDEPLSFYQESIFPAYFKNDLPLQKDGELMKYWFYTDIHITERPVPKTYYYETTIYGTRMGGYLSLVGPLSGNWNRYEGYLYNLKYPVPGPAKIKKEEEL